MKPEYIRKLAKYLDIPPYVVRHMKQKNWGVVKRHFQKRWNQDGYVAYKRNQNAVHRIINEFQRLKGFTNYKIDFETKKKLGIYVKKLGVKILINDMRSAIKKNGRIRSIKYFFTGYKDKKSRWGKLLLNHYNEEWKKEKQKYKQGFEEAAERIGLKQTMKRKQKDSKPAWIDRAIKKLKTLKQKGTLTKAEQSEASMLVRRLKKKGVNLKEVL